MKSATSSRSTVPEASAMDGTEQFSSAAPSTASRFALLLLLPLGLALWACHALVVGLGARRSAGLRVGTAESRRLSELATPTGLCNSSLAAPSELRLPNFTISASLTAKCEDFRASIPWNPSWFDRNWCWEWVKSTCQGAGGKVTWEDAVGLVAADLGTQKLDVSPLQGACGTSGARLWADPMHRNINVGAWFRENVEVYVINLDRDIDRLAHISMRLTQLGISFQRIRGVDLAHGQDSLAALKAEGLVLKSFEMLEASENAEDGRQSMGGIFGTVGVAAAHLRAHVAIEGQIKPLALVLEDDGYPSDQFTRKVVQLVADEVPCDWEALSLLSICPFGICTSPHLSRVIPDTNEPAWRCRHGVNYGFTGMVYKRDAMKTIRKILMQHVWDAERPHCLDIDVALASVSDEVSYYAVPASQDPPILQISNFGSSRMANNAAAAALEG